MGIPLFCCVLVSRRASRGSMSRGAASCVMPVGGAAPPGVLAMSGAAQRASLCWALDFLTIHGPRYAGSILHTLAFACVPFHPLPPRYPLPSLPPPFLPPSAGFLGVPPLLLDVSIQFAGYLYWPLSALLHYCLDFVSECLWAVVSLEPFTCLQCVLFICSMP